MADKKALLLLSSPRKQSNSTILGNEIASGFTEAGGDVERIDLAKLRIAPCRACGYCKTSADRYCVIEDDMEAVYSKLLQAEAIILASPIYWFHISAQLKLCIDRLYALDGRKESNVQNLLHGKRFALAFAFGDDDPVVSGAVNAYRSFQDAFTYIGAELIGTAYGCAEGAGEIMNDKTALAEAKKIGTALWSQTGIKRG